MMLTMEANTMNPDQTAPKGSILFAGGSELEWLTWDLGVTGSSPHLNVTLAVGGTLNTNKHTDNKLNDSVSLSYVPNIMQL